MDKLLRPERFESNPNTGTSARECNYWYKTFNNFLFEISYNPNKLHTLINYISHFVYEYISDCKNYEEAIETLVQLSNQKLRYSLTTRRQQAGENLDEYLQALKQLNVDCNFTSVSAGR